MVKKAFRTINLSRNGMYGQLKFRIRSVLTIQIKSFITICPSLMAISQDSDATKHSFVKTIHIYNLCLSPMKCNVQMSAYNQWPMFDQDDLNLIRCVVSAHGHHQCGCVPNVLHDLDWTLYWSPEARMFYGDIQDNSGPSSFLPLCALSVNLDLSGLLFRFSVTRMWDLLWCRDGHYEGQTNAVFSHSSSSETTNVTLKQTSWEIKIFMKSISKCECQSQCH